MEEIVLGVLGVAALLLAALLWQRWFRRRPVVQAARDIPVFKPDLSQEELLADELSEGNWLKLAAELSNQGEKRMALRALFLAGLAHLASRDMITVARCKSNDDYQSELRRRGRVHSDLREAFSENVRSFERVWYGFHEATQEVVDRFGANLERMKTGA